VGARAAAHHAYNDKRKAPLVSRADHPTMGLKRDVNFLKTNALDAKKSEPCLPPPLALAGLLLVVVVVVWLSSHVRWRWVQVR
jgi:hypothetical protein